MEVPSPSPLFFFFFFLPIFSHRLILCCRLILTTTKWRTVKCSRAWRQGSRALNNSWQHVIQQSSNVSNQVNKRAKRGIEPYTNIMLHHTYHFPSHLCPSHYYTGKEAEKDIEEHFAKCINALAERKAVLLKEAAHKVTNHSMIHSSFLML